MEVIIVVSLGIISLHHPFREEHVPPYGPGQPTVFIINSELPIDHRVFPNRLDSPSLVIPHLVLSIFQEGIRPNVPGNRNPSSKQQEKRGFQEHINLQS
jgi:hypothetical protein